MIKINKRENSSSYDVRVQSNDKLIGQFIQDVDGCYYFEQEEVRGLWAAHTLKAIADKLTEINKPWEDKIAEEFASDKKQSSESNDDKTNNL